MYNCTISLTDEQKTSLSFTKPNERYLYVESSKIPKETKEGNTIVQLDYGNEYVISTSKNIILNKQKYKIQEIEKNNKGYILYMYETITKSTNFIMPFLGGTRDYYRFKEEFINCYIGTEHSGDYGNYIYLLYRFSGSMEFVQFEERLQNHPYYESSYEVDNYQTMYVFNIPQDYMEEIQLILDGKYSKIKPETKENILRFNQSKQDSILEKILFKDPSWKIELENKLKAALPEEAELYSIFNVEEEIFREKHKIE